MYPIIESACKLLSNKINWWTKFESFIRIYFAHVVSNPDLTCPDSPDRSRIYGRSRESVSMLFSPSKLFVDVNHDRSSTRNAFFFFFFIITSIFLSFFFFFFFSPFFFDSWKNSSVSLTRGNGGKNWNRIRAPWKINEELHEW